MAHADHTRAGRARVTSTALVRFLCLLCLFVVEASASQDWPQFRGPDGLGVSAEVGLPTDLGPDSPHLAWKVVVPGQGASSPIVSRGRIFLTTAYRGEAGSGVRGLLRGSTLLLTLLALLGGAFCVIRRRRAGASHVDPQQGSRLRLAAAVDTLAIALTSLGFLVLALVATFDPGRLWTAGVPGDVWLITGCIALAGLVAAFGWCPARSPWRLIGALLLVAAGACALSFIPLNKHRQEYRLVLKLVMIAPALVGALWYLFLFLLSRRAGASAAGASVAGASVAGALALTGPALALLSVLVFVSSNFVNPRVGLMRAVVCLDLHTGEQLWNTPLFAAPEERLHRKNSFATPTPCTDGEYVFAYFGPGYACLDFDGNVLWQGLDESYHDYSRYGSVSSPVCFEDTFIIMQESEQRMRASYMMALYKRTGKERWRIEPRYAHDSYMTPLLMPVGGSTQLVTATFGQVVAYDPRTGEKLWAQELACHQHVPSLTYADDLLLVSGGAHIQFRTAALRLSGSGADTEVEVVWQTNKSVPNSSSPVLYGADYFTATDLGIMVCYDPLTGKRRFKERLPVPVLASLIAGDGKLFICTDEGDVLVLNAGPEFQILSQANLGEEIRATPAISDGCVLIRGMEHLYCFRQGPGSD
ncbi:MAG: PQQ-binding-like beta-propeller repeat protein [Planctomycetota bacterium]